MLVNWPAADARALTPRARPACPLRVRGYPSQVVAIEAGVPGTLISIAGIPPAGIAPQ